MSRTCRNCSQSNPADAAFCLNCASPLAFAPTPPAASQRAVTAALLALAGLVCCGPLTALPAAIIGWMEIEAIKKGESSPSGMKFAQAGLWGGIIITVLQAIVFFMWLLLAAVSDPYAY